MAVIGFQRLSLQTAVRRASEQFTIPNSTARAILQPDTADGVRYTLDGTTDPTTSQGFRILSTQAPQEFEIDDILRMRYCKDGSTDGFLNIHYVGRSI